MPDKEFQLRKPLVLVVDDEEDIITLLATNFVLEGYRVLEAMNGDEALRVVEEEQVDLVILDVMMPKMGGLEVLTRLRQDPTTAQLPIILLTASNLASTVARQNDPTWFVRKPIDPSFLMRIVRTILA